MTSNVIQLQNICNQVNVYNYSSETIPGPITLEILTNGIPIGFSLIYQTNDSCKSNESVSLTRKNPNSSSEDSRKRTTEEPYGITLAAGITINENVDPDVVIDMIMALNKIFPINGDYKHSEGNSHAHLKSSFVAVDQNLIIHKGSKTY